MNKFIIVFILIIKLSVGYKINITNFDNCERTNIDLNPVQLFDVKLIYDENRLCDKIDGKYRVKKVDTRSIELWLTIYNCPTDSQIECVQNPRKFNESLNCHRFITDTNGIWYMLSKAMTGSHCGQELGDFSLENAELKKEYLDAYGITDNIEMNKYRMELLFHKKGESKNQINPRACFFLDFKIISDN